MKLKHKEYNDIQNREKYEIKFSYDYQKGRREALIFGNYKKWL